MSNKYIIRSGAEVIGSGSSVFKVQGDSGTLIDVQDSLTGNIFSVTDSSSNSVFDVTATGDANLTGSLTASAAQIAGLNFPTADGSAGHLLKTDGSGNLFFQADATFPFTGDAEISGSLIISGSGLTVTGAYSQTGDMNVTGQIDGSSAIIAGGQLSGSSLSVIGDIDGAALNMSGQLSGSNLSVTGAVSGDTVSAAGAIDGASITVTGIVSGSSASIVGAVTASAGLISGSEGLEVYGSGSSVFSVTGDNGLLFDVQDSNSGNILSVTDASGNSIFDVAATGGATLTGSLNVSGSLIAEADLTASRANIAGINFPAADGISGQVIITDGAGNLSFSAGSATVFPFTGDAVISGSLNITGSGLVIDGDHTQTGNIDVTGQIDASGAIIAGSQLSGSSLSVIGDIDGAALNMSGQLSGSSVSVTGAISGTDFSGDSLTVSGKVSGSSAHIEGPFTASSALLGGLTYPTADGSAGHLLKTDGSGNLFFQADATFPFTGDAEITGSLVVSGSTGIEIHGSGSSLFSVTGDNGLLLDIQDSTSGDVLSVQDASGNALFDVHAAGGATLTGSLNVSGSVVAEGDLQGAAISGNSLSVTGAVEGASALISGVISGSSLELEGAVTASGGALIGALTFPTTDSTAGQVLATDGNGNLVFQGGASSVFPFAGDAVFSGSITVSGSGLTIDGAMEHTGSYSVNGDINIKDANLSYQENLDVDSAAPEVIASLAAADFDAMLFDFVVKKGTDLRAGTVFAVHDGSGTVRFNEVTTADHGDTSDVAFTVEVNSGNMELKATVASDDWTVKSLVRGL